MPKSMTGYGSSLIQADDWTIAWEIKSVNGKFLDLKWKIPQTMYGSVAGWEKLIRSYAKRGRVEIFLRIQITNPDLLGLELDRTMIDSMLKKLSQVAESRGHTFEPDYNAFLTIPSLWKEAKKEANPGFTADVQKGLTRALEDWNTSRAQEGAALLQDLNARISTLKDILAGIEALSGDIVQDRFVTIQERVRQILEQVQVPIDDSRMLQELAILSDKLDVSEELTRLTAHLKAIDGVLAKGGEMGRKLDFLMQECFREINTCGNKIQKHEIGSHAVAFKAELEKCREQIQNLE